MHEILVRGWAVREGLISDKYDYLPAAKLRELSHRYSVATADRIIEAVK